MAPYDGSMRPPASAAPRAALPSTMPARCVGSNGAPIHRLPPMMTPVSSAAPNHVCHPVGRRPELQQTPVLLQMRAVAPMPCTRGSEPAACTLPVDTRPVALRMAVSEFGLIQSCNVFDQLLRFNLLTAGPGPRGLHR